MCLSPEQQENIEFHSPDLLDLINTGAVEVVNMDKLPNILKNYNVSVFYGPSDGEYESQIRLYCEATSGACYWFDIPYIPVIANQDPSRRLWVDAYTNQQKAEIGNALPNGTLAVNIVCASEYIAPIIYAVTQRDAEIAMIMCLTDEPFKYDEGSLTTSSLELAMISEQLKIIGDKLKVFLLVDLLKNTIEC